MSDDLKVIQLISKLTGKELKRFDIKFLENNIDNPEFVYVIEGENVVYLGLNFFYVNLSESDQQKIEASLSTLQYLKGLSVKYKEIDQVPAFISNFKNLESLSLKENHLKALPDWMKEFKNLSYLNLENNNLHSLPDWIKEFKNLSHLNIERVGINLLPDWLETLENLKTLKARYNDLAWNKTNLKILRMVYQREGTITAPRLLKFQAVHDLPREQIEIVREFEKDNTETEKQNKRVNPIHAIIEDGKVVEWKMVGYNLNSLPHNFGTFNDLKSLTLSRCRLESLPESFGDLNELEFLDLSGNALTTLPDSFVNLTSITNLNLSNNQFIEIPSQLWALEELTVLNLNDNPFDPENMTISQKVPDLIRDTLRKKATIVVFISHAVIDFEPYRIKELVEYLEKQKEISHVFFCEEDLAGNIDEWMLNAVQKSQLILFLGTNKSVFNSPDCDNELQLADKFSIPVIPLKGKDVDWPDLAEKKLSRELGIEYDVDSFDTFCADLYKYIYNVKRELDLMGKEERRKGMIDIYERFRLMLDERLAEITRKIDDLARRVSNLEEKS